MKLSGGLDKSFAYKLITLLTFLFILISIYFSYKLYNQQRNLIDKKRNMASAINQVAKNLDKNSGTKISDNLGFKRLTSSKNIRSSLNKLISQSEDIVQQRDKLSDAVLKQVKAFDIDPKISKTELDNLNSYKNNLDSLDNILVAEKKKKELYANTLKDMGEELDQSVKLKGDLKKIKSRINTLPVKLKGKKQDLSQAKNSIKEKESKIEKLNKKIKGLKNQLSKARDNSKLKKENQKIKRKIEELKLQKEGFKQKINKLENKIHNLKEDYKGKTPKISSESILQQKPKIYQNITGKVIAFSEKWGTAVLNLGNSNKVTIKEDGEEKTFQVPLPKGKEMYVARDSEFIAKVKIVRVYNNYSVAKQSFPIAKEIKAGDKVFFPNLSNSSDEKTNISTDIGTDTKIKEN